MASASKQFSFTEVQSLIKLSIPLIITGFIESAVAFFSTIFLAHLGRKELAAGAIVSWIFVTIMVILWGTLTSISMLIAQKHGAKDTAGIAQTLRDGMILAILLVIPTSLLLWYISPVLIYFGQNPETVADAQAYMHGLVWGVFPDFTGIVLMQFLIGLGHTRTNLIFALVWVPLNVLCNYVLIFGQFGFPSMGIAGIGWGTTWSYWISTVVLMVYLLWHKDYRVYFQGFFSFKKPRFLMELWHVGLPMGVMYCIEIAFFAALTLMMGRIGSQVLAANQITMQYLGVFSVLTFAMAQAITVRMGHALGKKSLEVAIRAAYIGIAMTVVFMSAVAVIYLFFPNTLIALDLDLHDEKNAEVILYAQRFFAIAALFQLCEAVRFGFFGALRGLNDTRFTLLSSIITFWGISFPLGYVLAFYLHFGGSGFWWGIIIGETVGVILLFYRFRYKIKIARKYVYIYEDDDTKDVAQSSS